MRSFQRFFELPNGRLPFTRFSVRKLLTASTEGSAVKQKKFSALPSAESESSRGKQLGKDASSWRLRHWCYDERGWLFPIICLFVCGNTATICIDYVRGDNLFKDDELTEPQMPNRVPSRPWPTLFYSQYDVYVCLFVFVLALQRLHLRGRVNRVKRSLSGAVCVVTGGNSGIGFQTVRQLSSLGGTVVVLGRRAPSPALAALILSTNKPRTQETKTTTDNTSGPFIHFLDCDFNNLVQVKSTASRLLSTFSRLDVLVHCASTTPRHYYAHLHETSAAGSTTTGGGRGGGGGGGISNHIMVNLFAPLLLSDMLLPRLIETASTPLPAGGSPPFSRVVFLTCSSHWKAAPDFDQLLRHLSSSVALQTPKEASTRTMGPLGEVHQHTEPTATASQLQPDDCADIDLVRLESKIFAGTKLATILAASALARESDEPTTKVQYCVVNPGLCATKQRSRYGVFYELIEPIPFLRYPFELFTRKTAWEGSQSVVNSCLRNDLQNGGFYLENCLSPWARSPLGEDEGAAENLLQWARRKLPSAK